VIDVTLQVVSELYIAIDGSTIGVNKWLNFFHSRAFEQTDEDLAICQTVAENDSVFIKNQDKFEIDEVTNIFQTNDADTIEYVNYTETINRDDKTNNPNDMLLFDSLKSHPDKPLPWEDGIFRYLLSEIHLKSGLVRVVDALYYAGDPIWRFMDTRFNQYGKTKKS
jgi:hypothetical protein